VPLSVDETVGVDADQLSRRGVADALAKQLRTLTSDYPGRSSLVHIDGAWGAGKSTLMRFLRETLEAADQQRPPAAKAIAPMVDAQLPTGDQPSHETADEAHQRRDNGSIPDEDPTHSSPTHRWLVVSYDAWRQSKGGPPWLTILQAVRASVRSQQVNATRALLVRRA
jgi:hypothetical protein